MIMHELGIVFYIIRDVKEAAREHGVEHVNVIQVILIIIMKINLIKFLIFSVIFSMMKVLLKLYLLLTKYK